VHERTALGAFVTVFGVLLLPPAVALAREGVRTLPRDDERRDLVLAAGGFGLVSLGVATTSTVAVLVAALGVAALAALLRPDRDAAGTTALALVTSAALALVACEVVYVRDDYGDALHRMNTIFKLYFGAWLLLALALPWFVRAAAARLGRAGRTFAVAVVAAGLLAALCYPLAVVATRTAAGARPSLDGTRYLAEQHADDAAGIAWLRALPGTPVVLEATGDPYRYFGRVSANTGLPTVLGWANHERVWRGALPDLDARKREVETLYASTDLDEVDALLRRRRVGYVFVGELERRQFPAAGLEKFAAHPSRFERAFVAGGTEVFRVTMTSPLARVVTTARVASRTATPSGVSSGSGAAATPSGSPSGP
ncbi:MAG TPA: DUF2298 domain-containing protein, partial [Candidatus Binatia bacterium]|nr:DUF2298 domain-containing protein [Candidatus Binatia bacterium]